MRRRLIGSVLLTALCILMFSQSQPVLAVSKSLPRGWNMVAGPAGTSFPGWTIHYRDSGHSWESWQQPGTPLVQGNGYWLWLDSAQTVTINGPGSDSVTKTRDPSDPGWVQIGNPCALGPATLGGFSIGASWKWSAYSQSWQQIGEGSTLDVGEAAFVWIDGGFSWATLDAPACRNHGGSPPLPPGCEQPPVGSVTTNITDPSGCNPSNPYVASITVDKGAGGSYYVGEPITICYHLSPTNTPYHLRILKRLQTGGNQITYEGDDNGAGGGDCIRGVVGTPGNAMRWLRLETYVNGVYAAWAETYFYVN